MGIFAEDLLENDYDDSIDFNVMCTGCGRLVRESQTRFENGKSCCAYCKPF